MKCENCDNEHNGSYGSGRFCSDHCRRSFVAKQRHKSGALKNHLQKLHESNRKKLGWKCNHCGLILETRLCLRKHKHIVHGISPKRGGWNKGLTKETDKRIEKYASTLHHKYESGQIKPNASDATRKKISEALKKAIREGRAKGWQSRNIESYAEKFWKQVLANNNIQYRFNLPIPKKELGLNCGNCYFLDFALLDKKVDLEIDGSQHSQEERQISNRKRDKLLSDNGWKVYRIPWNKLKTEKDKMEMKLKVEKFLTWYNNL
jgi:very-short-patch-repair endonuclease